MIVFLLLIAAAVSPGYSSYQKADQLFVARRFPECFAALEEALRLDPKLVPALTLKAKLGMATDRFDVARQSLEQALTIDPAAEYAQFLYGMEAYLRNDLQAALPRFQKAHALNPKDARADLYLGLTFEGIGKTTDALSHYRSAISLEPRAEAFLPYGRLLFLLDRIDEAEAMIRRAVTDAPKSRDAHFELARILLKKDDSLHAAEEGETALKLSDGVTTDQQIHYLLLRAWRKAGNPDRALLHAGVLHAQPEL